ncbi:MAG TPA: hypothetical protein DCQ43_07515 [Treponema sp.]|nr:hypothetical protein [Treponema sp.]
MLFKSGSPQQGLFKTSGPFFLESVVICFSICFGNGIGILAQLLGEVLVLFKSGSPCFVICFSICLGNGTGIRAQLLVGGAGAVQVRFSAIRTVQ